MKYPKGGSIKRGGKKGSNDRDPFFEQETKKRRKVSYDDEDIESIESDAEENGFAEDKREAEDEDEFADETAGEKRKRVQEPLSSDGFSVIVKHRHSVVSVALSDDDTRGFSASKDGTILHWDVSSGEKEIYKWPSDETLKSHGMKVREPRNKKHSRATLALAVSSDGRYLATGGVDRHIHIWDVRTREHVQAFPGHRNTVSCLCFRNGSTELYSGSFDRSVKAWNVEDKAFVQDSFGHQDDVLAIDALRKERAISVGRDRTMQLHKMPEQARIMYRAPASSLESCCFISDTEYLSGSDNGTVALWGMLKKKPIFLLKNEHSLVADGITTNENGDHNNVEYNNSCTASSWVSSVAVCRGSDLAASGAGNGFVHFMAVEATALRPLFKLPLSGYVNSMAFAKSGKFLIAGVGQVFDPLLSSVFLCSLFCVCV
ncbi:hypothetical protein DY000_02013997 [Brassica cretica]|uniref:Anaphase-promoting complex subunit 4 WD40 domain-containing protein n=1 Tax=Brassica cretica TaxID=69181 RepID=A0ABQ7DA76_BRACR|nr:hypothetical protein DY000_02013997 [Brassica cretica]